MALTLEKPSIHLYKALMQVDKDFEAAGEEPYCGVAQPGGLLAVAMDGAGAGQDRGDRAGVQPQRDLFPGGRGRQGLLPRPVSARKHPGRAHLGGAYRLFRAPVAARQGLCPDHPAPAVAHGLRAGADAVLLTCDETNAASRHVIEKAGGDYCGNYRERGYNKRQYWFYKQRQRGGLEET